MMIIGVDFHSEFQQIAWVDTESGDFQEKRLGHREEAETFYRALAGQKVCVGMEASGQAGWFERLVAELAIRIADWRCGQDPDQARTQAEDGSPGCAVDSAVAAGRSLPEDLGTELGEPGSAATAVAPASHGAGAHADHESVASGGAERRTALQEEVV